MPFELMPINVRGLPFGVYWLKSTLLKSATVWLTDLFLILYEICLQYNKKNRRYFTTD